VRLLSDDTLIASLSDSHIGGDAGRDIFETPDDLASMLEDLDRHEGPVELVLAGDFVAVLTIVFGAFVFVARSVANRVIQASHQFLPDRQEGEPEPTVAVIRDRLESDRPPPLAVASSLDVGPAVFVDGHTHAPSLTRFRRLRGGYGAQVNSGCWVSRLKPVKARLGAPAVFLSRFVQTHVRGSRRAGEIDVELWEHPRGHRQRLGLAERLVAWARISREPRADLAPRVRDQAAIADPAA
jgi:hypothetical protein